MQSCGAGLTCQGTCQPCGGLDQYCCGGACNGLLCDGTFCRECCADCKNFGQLTVPLSTCVNGTYSDVCKKQNKCGFQGADACCAAGTCTNMMGNGLCH